jgi:hypothetical protein
LSVSYNIAESEQSIFALFYAGFPQAPPKRAFVYAPLGGSQLGNTSSFRKRAEHAYKHGAAERLIPSDFERMNLSQAIILFFAALLAGAINAVAGGGSFVTFPTLMFIGVPAKFANATNTVALWPGQVASIGAYRRQFTKLQWRMMTPLLVTCVIGGIGGAWVLLKTPTTIFVWLVPWLILSATVIFMMSGRVTQWVRRRTASGEHHEFSTWRGVLFQLVIAFYIGYFGAGAGILILAMLALLGMDEIHSMNALKALLTTISNGVALVMFIFSHAVYWPEAILMIVASMLGGYFGAHFAQKTKPEHVRRMVIVIGFSLTAYYFGKQLLH